MSSKSKSTFADLDENDLKLFIDYTGISSRQAKEVFDHLHVSNPNGKINHSEFSKFYSDIDPEKCKAKNFNDFTDMIFRSFDTDHNKVLTVKELLIGFAVITKGNIDERLAYAFSLYDM
jgi:Ca2+-binding EF-hand superfamily protein